MKVLSFDVGVRNLAGCMFEFSEDDQHIKLIWWECLDLLQPQMKFCEFVKNGQKCTRLAVWNAPLLNGEIINLCGCHKHGHTSPTISVNSSKELASSHQPPSPPLSRRCQYKSCKAFASSAVEQDHFCSKHANKIIADFNKKYALKKIKQPTCKHTEPKDLKLHLWRTFDAMKDLLTVDTVVIENQPSLKNPVMKSISETIFNFFLCRGIIDAERTNSRISDVRYVNPSNKMKLSIDGISQLQSVTDKALKYRKTKQLAVNQVADILAPTPATRKSFLNNKKKDDLADCLLQGIWFLQSSSKKLPSLEEISIVDTRILD